ncbi:MAG: arginine--tRNA ligase [Candidatus Aenigmarchaeota archaeon]|nr:arginine--tRNA ligase [Candidatus Aenigmarchaeota archaeon]
MYLREKIIKSICQSLKDIEFLKDEEIVKYIEEPPKDDYGDFACSIAFHIAKKMKKSPFDIANEIVDKIRKSKFIEKVEAKNGYVNFFLDYKFVSEILIKSVINSGKNYGKNNSGKNKRVMIEFSQPNPVHPMHIGHARTTLIGDSLSNIFEFNGYDVIRANYMNDVGLQVAKLVTAYSLWANNKKPEGKADLWLWKYYVKFHDLAKKDENLEIKAREMLRKFELLKDKETSKLWRKIVNWCIDGFKETYKNIDVKFDIYFYESDFREMGKKLVMKALKKGIAFKSEQGTIVANLEKLGLPNFVLLRSDGTGLYQTSDLSLTVHKFEKYKLHKSIWVVSSQQNLYFKQLFKTLEILGYKWVNNCYHLSFEHVVLQEGKMSSREGRAIMLDEVIQKLNNLALEEVQKRNNNLNQKEKIKIANQIGIGALKYWVLKIDTNNIITFDWKQMLSFDGNTGPYIQYACTRCNGILKKCKLKNKTFKVKQISPIEKKIIRKIIDFPEIVKKACKDMKPNYICNYVYELSSNFTEFYHSCPVIKVEDENLKYFRLNLVLATKIVIENCLNLLGIKPPKIM